MDRNNELIMFSICAIVVIMIAGMLALLSVPLLFDYGNNKQSTVYVTLDDINNRLIYTYDTGDTMAIVSSDSVVVFGDHKGDKQCTHP